MKRKETVDIIGNIISNMEIKIIIDNIIDNLNGTYTIETCNTAYLYPCRMIEIDGNMYMVLEGIEGEYNEFIFNEKFTIEGDVIPVVNEFILPPLTYFHGTVTETSAELDRMPDSTTYLPMVFFLEIFNEIFDNRDESPIDRESDIRLFFLSELNRPDWLTEQQYEYALKPMRNMCYRFIEEINKNGGIGKFDNYTLINHGIFGVYKRDSGHIENIFNENLSGVEMRINIPINSHLGCENFCN